MHDKKLYARILNIEEPWRVADVELNEQEGEVVVQVEHDGWPVRSQYVAEAQKKIAFDKLTLPGPLGRPLTGCDAPSIAGWPARMISG